MAASSATRVLGPAASPETPRAVLSRGVNPPDLSVVIIAFDERESLRPVVEELRERMKAAAIDYELVLVDDGSRDGTAAIADSIAASDERTRALHQTNKGIGGALRTGFDAARGSYVTWVPADGQIPPEVVVELHCRRRDGAMVTTVYRRREDPFYRTVISKGLNLLVRLGAGQRAKSGGNYLFERSAWERHGPRSDDSMMLSTLFRKNLRDAGAAIVEVEIDCRARLAGRSKVLNARTIARTLRGVLGVRGRSK